MKEDIFMKIQSEMKNDSPELLDDFKAKWNESHKQAFLWLQKKSEAGELTQSINKHLDDLFFALH